MMPIDSNIVDLRKEKLFPVSISTFYDLHTLKDPDQTIDDLIAGMIKRERDLRDWKMISEIDSVGDSTPLDPEEIMRGG